MYGQGGNGCLDVLLGLMEDFALAASKALGWCGQRGTKSCGPQQVGKICLR